MPVSAVGAQAGRVALNSAAATSYSLLTDPAPGRDSRRRDEVEARAWIRSERPGKTVCLRLRE